MNPAISTILAELRANSEKGESTYDGNNIELLMSLHEEVASLMQPPGMSLNSHCNEHPDGHMPNSTMSVLSSGIAVSVAVHLNKVPFEGQDQDQIASTLTSMFTPLANQDAVAEVTLEIGRDDCALTGAILDIQE